MISIGQYLDGISAIHTVTHYQHGNSGIGFANGWQISVAYHPLSYSDNRWIVYDRDIPAADIQRRWLDQTKRFEIAIFRPDGQFFVPHPESEEETTMVWGYLSSDELDLVVQALDEMPAAGELPFCPCPSCTRVPAQEATA